MADDGGGGEGLGLAGKLSENKINKCVLVQLRRG